MTDIGKKPSLSLVQLSALAFPHPKRKSKDLTVADVVGWIFRTYAYFPRNHDEATYCPTMRHTFKHDEYFDDLGKELHDSQRKWVKYYRLIPGALKKLFDDVPDGLMDEQLFGVAAGIQEVEPGVFSFLSCVSVSRWVIVRVSKGC